MNTPKKRKKNQGPQVKLQGKYSTKVVSLELASKIISQNPKGHKPLHLE